MKTRHTPLPLRLLIGALMIALIAVSCVTPLLTRGECAAMIAVAELGKPYILGKEGPDAFDCSGLIRTVCANFGVDLIHSAQFVGYDDQYETVSEAAALVPGDLIFFDTVEDRDECDHVGFWLGMNRFVHASSSEERVMISRFDAKWRDRFSWGKRVLAPYACDEWNELWAQAQRLLHPAKDAGEA